MSAKRRRSIEPPAVRCTLHCLDTPPRHADPIEVPAAGSTPFYLGRTRQTQIKDTFCARNQVSLTDVDLAKRTLTLKQIGMNLAGLNGFALEPLKPYPVRHGDVVEVLHGKYAYEVRFESDAKLTANAAAVVIKKEPIRSPEAAVAVAPLKRTRSAELKHNNNMVTSTSRTPTAKAFWESRSAGQLLVYTSAGVAASARIAAYDLDGTLIRTQSGNVFPKNSDDWQIAFAEVPAKLQQHARNGYKIVIFTNQAGIAGGRTDEAGWKRKLEAIVRRLGVPVQCFAATGATVFRKPRTGMWDTLREQLNGGERIDRQASWFVGDAAGRPAENGRKRKDHSLADRLFALNVRVAFQTPEEHFLGARVERFDGPAFDPATALREAAAAQVFEPRQAAETVGKEVQVIVMVGLPGSGKSEVARKWLEPRGCVVINQDTLKTWQKCVAMLESTLQSKRSAVIDNTNVDADSRARYVAVARRLGVPVRCFVMTSTLAQCKHQIAFRELTDARHSKIPDRLLLAIKNKYTEPQLAEGFTDVVRVNCVPNFEPADKQRASVYAMYLVEK